MKPDDRPIRHRAVDLHDVTVGGKAEGGGDNGWIEGYASVFDVVDDYDEVVRPGACAKTVSERVPAGKVKLMAVHLVGGGGTAETIGTVTQAREDARGLWIHADLAGTDLAQTTRQLVAEGHVTGLSIGYQVIAFGQAMQDGKQITELTEIRLLEVTVTPFPANEEALITAAKAIRQRGAALSDEYRAALRALLDETEPQDTAAAKAATTALHAVMIRTQRQRLDLLRLQVGA